MAEVIINRTKETVKKKGGSFVKKRFTPQQKRLITACMMIYSTAYFNRLNLSAALGSVMEALSLSATRAGVLPSAFAITYAAGQMLNGALVDRLNPVRHMFIGLAASAVCNLLMSVSGSFEMLLVLCLLNGIFQSMLWTPVVRLVAMHFNEEERPKANILISITLIIGHLGAWAISGYMSGILSWRASFAAPAALVLPVLGGAAWLLRGIPTENNAPAAKGEKTASASLGGALRVYWVSGFVILLACSVLFGFVRDGIRTWAPQILGEISGDAVSATTITLIIPLINAVGVWGSYALRNVPGLRNRRIVALLMAAGTLFCGLLTGASGVVLCALIMGVCCACMSGVEPLVTTLIPMEYDREKLIGLSAGLMDSFIYVGSALAGVLAGFIRESVGMNALFISWAGAALVAAAMAFVSDALLSRYRASQIR